MRPRGDGPRSEIGDRDRVLVPAPVTAPARPRIPPHARHAPSRLHGHRLPHRRRLSPLRPGAARHRAVHLAGLQLLPARRPSCSPISRTPAGQRPPRHAARVPRRLLERPRLDRSVLAPAWTARQQAIRPRARRRCVYTPELVAGGAIGMVGTARLRSRPRSPRRRRSSRRREPRAGRPTSSRSRRPPRPAPTPGRGVGRRDTDRPCRAARTPAPRWSATAWYAGWSGSRAPARRAVAIAIGPWTAGGAVAFAQRRDK